MPAYQGVMTDEPEVRAVTFKDAMPSTRLRAAYRAPLTISPASVAANTTAEQTFTLNGVRVGDVVYVSKPSVQAGLGIVNVRVSAANQIAITFANNTASPIVPTASETYQVGGIR